MPSSGGVTYSRLCNSETSANADSLSRDSCSCKCGNSNECRCQDTRCRKKPRTCLIGIPEIFSVLRICSVILISCAESSHFDLASSSAAPPQLYSGSLNLIPIYLSGLRYYSRTDPSECGLPSPRARRRQRRSQMLKRKFAHWLSLRLIAFHALTIIDEEAS